MVATLAFNKLIISISRYPYFYVHSKNVFKTLQNIYDGTFFWKKYLTAKTC